MPTYDYQCPRCDNKFEKFQRISDKPGAECPTCSSPAQRLISSGAGLLFKGSGFYITDYRSDGYKKAAEKEKPASASSTSDAKSDTKSKETGKSKKE